MINNINTESDCKRIAKYIMKKSVEPDVIGLGKIMVHVSGNILRDFHKVGEKEYVKLVNKYLKGIVVSYDSLGLAFGYDYICFKITLI